MGRKRKEDNEKLKPISITVRGEYIAKHGYDKVKRIAQEAARNAVAKVAVVMVLLLVGCGKTETVITDSAKPILTINGSIEWLYPIRRQSQSFINNLPCKARSAHGKVDVILMNKPNMLVDYNITAHLEAMRISIDTLLFTSNEASNTVRVVISK